MADMNHSDDVIDQAAETSSGGVGLTSAETDDSRKSLLQRFTIYEVMLLLALIFITLATLRLILELREFGNFPFTFPWRTGEFLQS